MVVRCARKQRASRPASSGRLFDSLAAETLQLAAPIPNFLIQERGDNEYTDLFAKPLLAVVNGHRPLLTEPGLGITIDEDKFKAAPSVPRVV